MRNTLGLLVLVTLLVVAATISAATPSGKWVYPVVDVDMGLLLGGTVNGEWMRDEDLAPHLRGGERYQLYTLSRRWGQMTGTKPQRGERPFHEAFFVEASPYVTQIPDDVKGVIGIGGAWNALPRVPRVQTTAQSVYRRAVRDILRRQGLGSAKINLTRVLRVDLEGDGIDEVLISATNDRPNRLSFTPQKGDYSLVALRKLVAGKVRTTILDAQFARRGGLAENDSATVLTIPAVLDVNGDGVMEPFVQWEYYEGAGKGVYAVKGAGVKRVFGAGLGV